MNSVRIGRRKIGAGRPVYVIAEVGSNHNRKLSIAKKMIDFDAEAGADAVKFQWTSNARILEQQRGVSTGTYTGLNFDRLKLRDVRAHAKDAGLDFMCTVYLADDIERIAPLVDAFKVSSFEATDMNFIDHVYKAADGAFDENERNVYVSVGMLTQYEIDELYPPGSRARLLHCVSGYPVPLDRANLGVLHTRRFHGYSDHTEAGSGSGGSVLSGAFAVAAGARAIEVHFRLNDTSPTHSDFPHSRAPWELREYITMIRLAERSLGSGVKRCEDVEAPNQRYQRGIA